MVRTGLPVTGDAGMIARNTPNAFHVMARPMGSACNLHCDYCFFLYTCNHLVEPQDGEAGLNCAYEEDKASFEHADRSMRIMTDLIRRGRPRKS